MTLRAPRRLTITFALGVQTLAGCNHASVLDAPTQSGSLVRDLTNAADTTLLLVLAPEECFSCGVDPHQWSNFARSPERQTVFVLTRPPGPREKRELVVRRITPAGMLAPDAASDIRTPYTGWVVGERVVKAGSLRDQRIRAAVATFLTTEAQ